MTILQEFVGTKEQAQGLLLGLAHAWVANTPRFSGAYILHKRGYSVLRSEGDLLVRPPTREGVPVDYYRFSALEVIDERLPRP